MEHVTSWETAIRLEQAGFVIPEETTGAFRIGEIEGEYPLIYCPGATEIMAQMREPVSIWMYDGKWTCSERRGRINYSRNENPAEAVAEMFIRLRNEAAVHKDAPIDV